MAIDLNSLEPAPWWNGSDDDAHMVYVSPTEDHTEAVADCGRDDGDAIAESANAAFIALARNAFDVMLRRGWTAVPFARRDGKIASWNVAHENGSVQGPEGDGEWADPFTALVEADKWFRENVDKT